MIVQRKVKFHEQVILDYCYNGKHFLTKMKHQSRKKDNSKVKKSRRNKQAYDFENPITTAAASSEKVKYIKRSSDITFSYSSTNLLPTPDAKHSNTVEHNTLKMPRENMFEQDTQINELVASFENLSTNADVSSENVKLLKGSSDTTFSDSSTSLCTTSDVKTSVMITAEMIEMIRESLLKQLTIMNELAATYKNNDTNVAVLSKNEKCLERSSDTTFSNSTRSSNPMSDAKHSNTVEHKTLEIPRQNKLEHQTSTNEPAVDFKNLTTNTVVSPEEAKILKNSSDTTFSNSTTSSYPTSDEKHSNTVEHKTLEKPRQNKLKHPTPTNEPAVDFKNPTPNSVVSSEKVKSLKGSPDTTFSNSSTSSYPTSDEKHSNTVEHKALEKPRQNKLKQQTLTNEPAVDFKNPTPNSAVSSEEVKSLKGSPDTTFSNSSTSLYPTSDEKHSNTVEHKTLKMTKQNKLEHQTPMNEPAVDFKNPTPNAAVSPEEVKFSKGSSDTTFSNSSTNLLPTPDPKHVCVSVEPTTISHNWTSKPTQKFNIYPTTDLVTYDFDANGHKVGILHCKYPYEHLNENQLILVQEAVLENVEKQIDEEIKPRFFNSCLQPGWLLLTCSDRDTVEWLKGLCLKPWPDANLMIREEKDIPPDPALFFGSFPNGLETSEQILRYLKAQNAGLDTENWREYNKEDKQETKIITFAVDQNSAEQLKKFNYILSYKFGTVMFQQQFECKQDQINAPINNLP